MIETRRLKNVVIFVQTILSFVLSRKIVAIFVLRFQVQVGTCWDRFGSLFNKVAGL